MILALALLYLVLAPGANYTLLIPVLALIGAVGTTKFVSNSGVIKQWMAPFFWLIAWGVWVIIVGLASGNSGRGLTDTAVPLVLGPAFWLLATHATSDKFLRWVAPAIAAGVVGVSIVVIGTLFGVRIPILSGLNANLGGNTFDGAGVTKVRLTSASSLLPGIPFLMTLAVLGRDSMRPVVRRWVLTALPIGFVGLIMAGRQAGLLTVALTILLIPLLPRLFRSGVRVRNIRLSSKRVALLVAAVLVGAIAATQLGISPVRLITRFLASIGLAEDDTLRTAFNARSSQIEALLAGFRDSPIVGHGAGATSEASIRNVEYPWRFEMQYHLLVFEGGLVALGLFSAAIRSGARLVRSAVASAEPERAALLIASSVAALAMLVANGTNPYLRQVGLQFWVFLPLILIHAGQRADRRPSQSRVDPSSRPVSYQLEESL